MPLVDVQLTDGESDIMLFASNGKAVRFDESTVRSMGRTATGVRGMRLARGRARGQPDRACTAMATILTATERGFGKRTALDEYPKQGPWHPRRHRHPVTSERNGALVGAVQVSEQHEIMLISDQGTLVRTRAAEVAASDATRRASP
jgi:DNA gyrase subunit A